MLSNTSRRINSQKVGASPYLFPPSLLTFGIRKALGECFLDNETFESSHSLPSPRVTQRRPSRRLLRAGASTSSSPPSPTWLLSLSLPPSTSRCPCRHREHTPLGGILESSPGEVCPAGSTMALLHCGDRQGSNTGFCYRSLTLPRMHIRLRSARC